MDYGLFWKEREREREMYPMTAEALQKAAAGRGTVIAVGMKGQ